MASSTGQWPGEWRSDGRSIGRDAPTEYESRDAAFRAAKQDARVPSDCRVDPAARKGGRSEAYNGFPGETFMVYDFNIGGGTKISISDHYLGHRFSDGREDLRPHIHVRPSTEARGYIPTAYEHYYYKK